MLPNKGLNAELTANTKLRGCPPRAGIAVEVDRSALPACLESVASSVPSFGQTAPIETRRRVPFLRFDFRVPSFPFMQESLHAQVTACSYSARYRLRSVAWRTTEGLCGNETPFFGFPRASSSESSLTWKRTGRCTLALSRVARHGRGKRE